MNLLTQTEHFVQHILNTNIFFFFFFLVDDSEMKKRKIQQKSYLLFLKSTKKIKK